MQHIRCDLWQRLMPQWLPLRSLKGALFPPQVRTPLVGYVLPCCGVCNTLSPPWLPPARWYVGRNHNSCLVLVWKQSSVSLGSLAIFALLNPTLSFTVLFLHCVHSVEFGVRGLTPPSTTNFCMLCCFVWSVQFFCLPLVRGVSCGRQERGK